jgi:hypothetical protein
LRQGLRAQRCTPSVKRETRKRSGTVDRIRRGALSPAPSNATLEWPAAQIVAKDAPILAASIDAGYDWFVTGDRRAFGQILGSIQRGVRVISPSGALQGLATPHRSTSDRGVNHTQMGSLITLTWQAAFDPLQTFRSLQSSPTLGPPSFCFCIAEAAAHGYRLPTTCH